MILSLKNIAKVESAVVELDGITVIAGENNTGKSTVGKVLYSVFNGFYKIDEQIQQERIEILEKMLDVFYRNVTGRMTMRVDTEEIARSVIGHSDKYRENTELLKAEIIDAIAQIDTNFEEQLSESDCEDDFKRIAEILDVSDQAIFVSVLSKKLDTEFNGQINNIFNEKSGEITLKIKNNTVSVVVEDNSVKSISNNLHLNTEALYIDDPFVIDDSKSRYFYYHSNYANHRNHLQAKLFNKGDSGNIINQIIATNKLDNIYAKINMICSGDMVHSKRSDFGYKRANSDKILDVKNISTGLKTFVILKTLLQNGSLEENGTLVLDEPEIHLHPEWQILFAELIVLIQKEFNMHILLNTHSPYFLNAIEVYAAKYKIADRCKYYLASLTDDVSKIIDVTDNVEMIYNKLARPLQRLENERWGNDV